MSGVRRVFALAATVSTVAGCGLLAPRAPEVVEYRCDAGRGFTVAYHPGGETATIDIERMRFELIAEASSDGAKHYGCSVLTLKRGAGSAGLDFDGAPQYRNCRPLAAR